MCGYTTSSGTYACNGYSYSYGETTCTAYGYTPGREISNGTACVNWYAPCPNVYFDQCCVQWGELYTYIQGGYGCISYTYIPAGTSCSSYTYDSKILIRVNISK